VQQIIEALRRSNKCDHSKVTPTCIPTQQQQRQGLMLTGLKVTPTCIPTQQQQRQGLMFTGLKARTGNSFRERGGWYVARPVQKTKSCII
jgi:hypothetical protein